MPLTVIFNMAAIPTRSLGLPPRRSELGPGIGGLSVEDRPTFRPSLAAKHDKRLRGEDRYPARAGR
jgi:hypothetical protein